MEIVGSLFQSDVYQASKKMLDVTALRHQALASNVANATTPGYKRVDISKTFEQELQNTIRGGKENAVASLKPTVEVDSTTHTTRLDGNNVQIDQELMNISSNTTNYQTVTQFVSGSLRQLRVAITGRSA